jgi:hypothetical protein
LLYTLFNIGLLPFLILFLFFFFFFLCPLSRCLLENVTDDYAAVGGGGGSDRNLPAGHCWLLPYYLPVVTSSLIWTGMGLSYSLSVHNREGKSGVLTNK